MIEHFDRENNSSCFMKNLTKPENPRKVIIFDTTMGDGELTPGVKMNVQQKIRLAKLLETIGLDVI